MYPVSTNSSNRCTYTQYLPRSLLCLSSTCTYVHATCRSSSRHQITYSTRLLHRISFQLFVSLRQPGISPIQAPPHNYPHPRPHPIPNHRTGRAVPDNDLNNTTNLRHSCNTISMPGVTISYPRPSPPPPARPAPTRLEAALPLSIQIVHISATS